MNYCHPQTDRNLTGFVECSLVGCGEAQFGPHEVGYSYSCEAAHETAAMLRRQAARGHQLALFPQVSA